MTDVHERKCWDCGHIGEHQDRITPWVLCPKCGSQDTRATKKPRRLERYIKILEEAIDESENDELLFEELKPYFERILFLLNREKNKKTQDVSPMYDLYG